VQRGTLGGGKKGASDARRQTCMGGKGGGAITGNQKNHGRTGKSKRKGVGDYLPSNVYLKKKGGGFTVINLMGGYYKEEIAV